MFYFVSCIICVGVSLTTQPQDLEEIKSVVFRPTARQLATPVWKEWRVWNGALIGATAALVIAFW